jgi:hypothetical protein
MLKAL